VSHSGKFGQIEPMLRKHQKQFDVAFERCGLFEVSVSPKRIGKINFVPCYGARQHDYGHTIQVWIAFDLPEYFETVLPREMQVKYYDLDRPDVFKPLSLSKEVQGLFT
jgi:hypothetical protein